MILAVAAVFSVLSSAGGLQSGEDENILVPIIMYHEVKSFKTGKDVITPCEFENDLKYFKENGYETITMTDLINFVQSDAPLPENPVVITFDDGYLNNYVYVFPLLKRYNMKAVLSIIGKNTDDFTRIPDNNLDYSHANWGQLREMADSGLIEIQNHTYNLHKISKKRYGCRKNSSESSEQYEKVLTEDLIKLQKEVFINTGFIPNTFAYPYGRVSKDSLPIIKKLGFQATLTCDYGVNVIGRRPESLFDLKRICRSHGKPLQNLIKEAMKTVKHKKQI